MRANAAARRPRRCRRRPPRRPRLAAQRRDRHQPRPGAAPRSRRRGRPGRQARPRARRRAPGRRRRCTAPAPAAAPVRSPASTAAAAARVQGVGEADGVDRLHRVRPTATTARALLRCRPPTKCQRGRASGRRAATSATLRPPPAPGSPRTAVSPRSSSSGDVRGRHGLRDGQQLHPSGSRPAAAHAAAIRSRTAASRRASSARRASASRSSPTSRAHPMTGESARLDSASRHVRQRESAESGERVHDLRRDHCATIRCQNVPTRGTPAHTQPVERADSRGDGLRDGSSQVTAASRPVRRSRRWL